MTLCIAAHSAEGTIISVSDRMISRGPLRHLPPGTKVYGLHHQVVLLYAGGVSLSHSLAAATAAEIDRRYAMHPIPPCTVLEAADIYMDHYRTSLSGAAAAAILPLYFIPTVQEYHAIRHTLPDETLRSIERRIKRFRFNIDEDPAVIVAGIDPNGPHIYEISGGRRDNRDSLGFAVIGSNPDPALDLLHDEQAPHQPFGEALMLAYIAARRAEDRDAGVGPPTDILFFGPELERYGFISTVGMERLAAAYEAAIIAPGRLDLTIAFNIARPFQREPDLTPPPETPPAEVPPIPPESTHGQ